MGPLSASLSRLKSKHAPQLTCIWYAAYNVGIVCILPWFSILWHELGFTGGQLGILSGLRPFVAAVSGQTLVGFADARGWHFWITVVTYVVTFVCRGGMGVFSSFLAHVLLIFISEACQAPFSIMADAAAAATSKDEGEYGMRKLWGSVGWGAVAPLSGYIVQTVGVRASIAVYFGVVVATSLPTLLLPLEQLSAAMRRGEQGAGGAGAAAGAAGTAGAAQHGITQPLLSEEDERTHGGKAAELAIELTDSLEMAERGRVLVVAPLPSQESLALPRKVPPASLAPPPKAGEGWSIPALPAWPRDGANAPAAALVGAAAAPLSPPTSLLAARGLPPLPAINTALPSQSEQSEVGQLGRQQCVPSPLSTARGGELTSRSTRPMAIGSARRPLSQASMASTAFFSVKSSSSLTSMMAAGLATPTASLSGGLAPGSAGARAAAGGVAGGFTPLSKQISNASQLSGYLSPRDDPSAHNTEGGYGSPLTAVPTPFAAVPSPFDPDSTSPLSAAAEAAGVGAGALLPGVFDAAALHLPRLHSVHPPWAAAAAAGDAPGLAAAESGQLTTLLLPPTQLRSHHGESLLPATGSEQLIEPVSLPVGAPGLAHASMEALLPGSAELSHHPASPRSKTGTALVISLNAVASVAAPARRPAAPAEDLSVLGGILLLLRDPHVAAFFFLTLLCGLGYGCVGYLNLFLREQGASGILMGLCQTVDCMGEVLAFYFSGWWLARLGVARAFNLAMLGWVLRLGGYVLVPLFPTPWLVLCHEPLQGLTFGVAYCVGTVNCKRIAPPHLRSTVQSLFFCLYYGVGPGISGLAGGYIYQAVGMRSVFLVFGSLILAGWLGTLLLLRCVAGGRSEEPAAVAAEPGGTSISIAPAPGMDGVPSTPLSVAGA